MPTEETALSWESHTGPDPSWYAQATNTLPFIQCNTQGITQQMRVGQLVLLSTSNFQHTRLTPFAPSEAPTAAGPHRHQKALHLRLPVHLNACLEYSVPYSLNIKPKQSIPTKISMAYGRAQCPLLQACIEACLRTISAHKHAGEKPQVYLISWKDASWICLCRKTWEEVGTGEFESYESSLTAKGKQLLHERGIL